MASIQEKRHSLAHLLAIAALEHDPKALLSVGPVTENGFYYDIQFSEGRTPIPEDFRAFEKTMRKQVNKKLPFVRQDVSVEEARTHFKGNPFKLAIIDDLAQVGTPITLYTTGDFTDLCAGGHVENTSEIDAQSFMLTHLAGAYWRGDEKNPMLTRVYGLAFETETDLRTYLAQQEEAKKRDHRKLGRELDLFTLSELVGSGLPLFTPKGCFLRDTLAGYSQELQAKYGFERVWTPHMARTELYKHSGHYEKYPERFEVTSAESDDVFMLKPMNCPHHAQLFARKPWSYRELPVRYMENTTNYRDEKSGELHGLARVRSLSQDDGHVFCQEKDMETELRNVVLMVKELYTTLRLDFYARLSFRDDSDKFLGDAATWELAESVITKVAKEESLEAIPGPGEAAFYGPKIDFMVRDSLGREWQCATVQLDFVQPERFGLAYVDSDGAEKRPVMIHKALLGSLERFLSVYIEHTAGIFPLWLAPVQVKVLPISEKHLTYAEGIVTELWKSDIRVELDRSDESLGKKVRNAKVEKVPYIVVVGDQEVTAETLSVEHRSEGKIGALTLSDFLSRLQTEITEKK
ncbi:MAG: threonine--tRNA ligase [Candidatus Moraniibacteriota bacterium]